jgi:hypothetical protein
MSFRPLGIDESCCHHSRCLPAHLSTPTPRIPFLPNGINVGTDMHTHTHVMFVAFTSRCSDRGLNLILPRFGRSVNRSSQLACRFPGIVVVKGDPHEISPRFGLEAGYS